MLETRTKTLAADLRPGQFFFVNDRWYRAASTLQDLGNGPQIKATNPRTGATVWMWLYSTEVTVNEGNTVPQTFSPASLARKAKAAREKAAEQALIAHQLDTLAVSIQA